MHVRTTAKSRELSIEFRERPLFCINKEKKETAKAIMLQEIQVET